MEQHKNKHSFLQKLLSFVSFRLPLFFVFIMILVSNMFTYIITKNDSDKMLQNMTQSQAKLSEQLENVKKELVAATKANDTKEALTQQLQQLKQEIQTLQEDTKRNQILGLIDMATGSNLLLPAVSPVPSPSPTPLNLNGSITIKSSTWPSVDVFQDKNSSSRIIGQAYYGKIYNYTKKENDYYYITLSTSTKGWIHSQFVKETTKTP